MTANEKNLGRLERVDLREIWTSESGDFTPWLAKEENLALLGDTIGIELELEAQEKSVGPFRADILCKDTASNDWVLIENQLECTDHTHLGQLLTYAAGLKAVTIVWIAERFTEEHRAALDWLNEIAGESLAIFGLEIELWRIAGSPIAPKFNIVCEPNVSSKAVSRAAEGTMSETQLLQQEYWTGLRDLLLRRKSVVTPQKPQPACWTNFAIGRAYFGMYASVNAQKNQIRIAVSCSGADRKAHFAMLREDKEAIEQAVGCPLEWEERPNRKNAQIVLRKPQVDPTNRNDWPAQHEWMAEKLEAFHRTFAPRIKELDAEDWTTNGQPI